MLSPGEFVYHFQLHTKDFTTVEVPPTICNKYRQGPTCICKGNVARHSEVVSKIKSSHWVSTIPKHYMSQGRRESPHSVYSLNNVSAMVSVIQQLEMLSYTTQSQYFQEDLWKLTLRPPVVTSHNTPGSTGQSWHTVQEQMLRA